MYFHKRVLTFNLHNMVQRLDIDLDINITQDNGAKTFSEVTGVGG